MAKNTPALDQVMAWLDTQDDLEWDFKIPADIYAQAVSEGLAGKFNFYVCCNHDSTGPDDESPALYAVVYPVGMDATWKGPLFIEQLLPEAVDFDECMETEWHFHKAGLTTPAEIATLLTKRGLIFDAQDQARFYPNVLAEVSNAVAAATAPAAKSCSIKPPKP